MPDINFYIIVVVSRMLTHTPQRSVAFMCVWLHAIWFYLTFIAILKYKKQTSEFNNIHT